MKEFMLYIRNAGDAKAALSPENHEAFIKQCEAYIEKLRAAGKLISAQPVDREGSFISKSDSGWIIDSINPMGEVQVGYYHILANNLEEAIAIAKDNPEFEYIPSATIEVRPVKIKEEQTKFVYPARTEML